MKKLACTVTKPRNFTDLQIFVNALREVLDLDPLYGQGQTMTERFYRSSPSLPYAQPRSKFTGRFMNFGLLELEVGADLDSPEDQMQQHQFILLKRKRSCRTIRDWAVRRWDRVRAEKSRAAT